MYAVVEQGGKQYRVSEGDTLKWIVLRPKQAPSRDGPSPPDRWRQSQGGNTRCQGAKVTAKVIAHQLGDKVETFKYRPRKRYRKLGGFRASLTQIEITGIKA